MKVIKRIREWRRVESLRREMRSSAKEQMRLGTEHDRMHDRMLAYRTMVCRYHPDNGGRGRFAGDERHFDNYVEDVLGPWPDREAHKYA